MESLLLFLILALVGLWFMAMQAREKALTFTRRACTDMGVYLLDDTVALNGLRFARNRNGQLCFKRCFRFEYTRGTDFRHKGTVILLGNHVDSLLLDPDIDNSDLEIPL
ncbi:MAG: DUF3301 domain-containing protein [Magnetococcales bacterium]|nr:DUF3301 domain-containing protein [Magnetococcales bacterium]